MEDEQREARIAAETRAKNKAHRLKIDNEVLGAIVALDIPMDRAQDLLIAIAKGAVPHVTIRTKERQCRFYRFAAARHRRQRVG